MHEFPELQEDFDFLKKFENYNKNWCDFNNQKRKAKKVHLKSRFSLHPKRLSSDSDCSSRGSSPTKFRSSTVTIQDTNNTDKANNNNNDEEGLKAQILEKLHKMRQDDTECRFVEQQPIGDTAEIRNKSQTDSVSEISNSKTITLKKKSRKLLVHPSSCRLDNNVEKKLRFLIERTLRVISNIRDLLIKGIEPCDGEEDYTRRLKRSQEFSARFSRIYLYPLIRQMDELNLNERSLSTTSINQKIIQAHQFILQGAQSYYNHLPNAVDNCCSDKLKSLLEQTMFLCQHYGLFRKGGDHSNKSEIDEFVNALQSHTELLIETVDIFDNKLNENKTKNSEVFEKKKIPKKPQNKLRDRLSMYNVTASFRRDTDWKKAVESLATKKYNVKSRYKTAAFKHRPPIEKPHIVSLPSKIKLFPKRSSGMLKNTPIKSPMNENDLETMVGLENSLQVPVNSTVGLNHHETNPQQQQQLVRDNDLCENELGKALEMLKKCLENRGEDAAKIVDKIASEVDQKIKKDYKPPTITVTGAKNARLICIKDDNSIVEILDNGDEEENNDRKMETTIKSSETQTDLQERNKCIRSNKSTIKISRLTKNYRNLKLLPNDLAINVIQYKLLYHEFHKPNPMYRKSSTVQPWILMGQISDQLLDDILKDVSAELEVTEVLENLYNAEFQY